MDSVLLQKIQDTYGIAVETLRRVEKGVLSINYRVSTPVGEYFLKQYRFQDEEQVREVHAAKKYFFERGIPVIMPLSTLATDTLFFAEEKWHALFPFVYGKQFEHGSLPDEAAVSLGEMLGRMHAVGRDSVLRLSTSFKPWDKGTFEDRVALIRKMIDLKGDRDHFDEMTEKLLELRESLVARYPFLYEELDFASDHLIHGDFHAQNVFFDEGGAVAAVFDLENAKMSPRIHETLRCLTLSFLPHFTEEEYRKAQLFLKAYSNTYPLSPDELRRGIKLYFMKVMHGMWIEISHYIEGNTRGDMFLENDYGRLSYLAEHLDAFTDNLLAALD